MTIKVNPINYKIHAAWLGVLGMSGAFSLMQISDTIAVWTQQRQNRIAHAEQVSKIEQQAALTQAAIDNHINLYDSVVVTGYVCDPANPPSFDAAPFAKDGQIVKVSDINQRVVGYIDASGVFHFQPGYCQISAR